MRKRVTFDELARSTLVKQTVTPSPLPYDPPYDNTFAVMELRQRMDKLRQDAENAEDARHDEARATRNLGVDPELLRKMAEGITTEGSNMHEETRRQAQTMMLQHKKGSSFLPSSIYENRQPNDFFLSSRSAPQRISRVRCAAQQDRRQLQQRLHKKVRACP